MVSYQKKYDRLKKFLIYFLGEGEGNKRAFNLMRKRNLKTYIFKFGIEIGTLKYNHALEIDKFKNTLPGFIKRYGEEVGSKKYYEKNRKLSVGYDRLKRDGYTEEQIKEIKTKHSKGSSSSLNSYIEKYGEEIGSLKYNKRRLSSVSHRSWKDVQKFFSCSEEEAKEFVSCGQRRNLNFYHKKYGIEVGNQRYKNANLRRAYANTKDYYIEKYGKEDGLQKYKQRIIDCGKGSKIEYYVEKYGEEIGSLKYKDILHRKSKSSRNSNIQNEFSTNLYNMLDDNYKSLYYGSPITDSFNIFVNPKLKYSGKMICPDIRIKNIIIEFDGDYWHSREDVKIKDAQKDIIYHFLGYDLIRVSENKYKNNKQKTLIECIEFINAHITEDFKNENYKC